MANYDLARLNMVESQIRTNRVSDPALLEALESVPRERFLPPHLRGVAYVDLDVELGAGRFLLEPRVLARLLQEAAVGSGDLVLDVAAGSGYSSALLSRLAASVVALESVEALRTGAEEALAELGADNVAVVDGAIAEGCPRQAPFDVILINGAVSELPGAIAEQLADGGRLVAVVRTGTGPGRATLARRNGDTVSALTLFDAGTPVLPEFQKERGFVF